MRKAGLFKKILAGTGLLASIVAGYLAMSVATSCKSQAYLCICSGAPCIESGAGQELINIVLQVVMPDLLKATEEVTFGTPEGDGGIPLNDGFELRAISVALAWAAKIEMVKETYKGLFETLWEDALHPALRNQTRQWTIRDADQAVTIHRFLDALDVNRARLEQQLQEVRSHREFRPSENVCAMASTVGGLPRQQAMMKSYNNIMSRTATQRSGNVTGQPSARGMAADQASNWTKYTTKYCDHNDNAGAAGCTADGALVRKDIDVDQLFATPTLDVKNNPNLQDIIQDVITNLSAPFVPDPIPAQALTTSGGQEKFFRNQALATKRQAVNDALAYVISVRIPGMLDPNAGGTGNGRNMLAEMRNAAKVEPGSVSTDPSLYEFMQTMAKDKYRTGEGYSGTQVNEPENNQREAVDQQVVQLMQLNMMNELLERYSLVVASQTADDILKTKSFSSQTSQMRSR